MTQDTQSRESLDPQPLYPWIMLVGLMDVFLTARILDLGGTEVNAIANHVLEHAGVPGLLVLKLTSFLIVVAICEFIAARHDRRAVLLAQAGIVLNALPVSVGAAQLALAFAPLLFF